MSTYLQSGAIAEMVADGSSPGLLRPAPDASGAAAAGEAGGAVVAVAAAAGDGLREETLLQRKLAEYASSIGQFGLGAAGLATAAMTLRFRHACCDRCVGCACPLKPACLLRRVGSPAESRACSAFNYAMAAPPFTKNAMPLPLPLTLPRCRPLALLQR